MAQARDIDERLCNWARWLTSGRGHSGADSMTGAVCERMRRAELGDVWSGHQVTYDIKEADALAIERGMRELSAQHRLILWWCYYQQAQPEVICRKMSLPRRPISVFVDTLLAAKEAIQEIVDSKEKRV